MKIHLIYLLIGLSYFGIGCQEQYSDAMIEEYFELDERLKNNNQFVQETTNRLVMEIEEHARIRTQLQLLVDKARAIQHASIDLDTFIMHLRETLIMETGGFEEEDISIEHLRPKGARNVALVERILFHKNTNKSDPANSISTVEILEQKIQSLYNDYFQIIASCWDNGGLKGSIFADFKYKEAQIASLKKNIVLHASLNYKPEVHHHQTWAEFNLKNKPLAAVLPILRAIQNDIKASEYTLINFLAMQFSGCNFQYESFDVIVQSTKACIRLGEIYESEISLGTYASKEVFDILINGDTLPQIDGKAIYRVRPDKTGEQTYRAKFIIPNPLTGEVSVLTKAFYFEVIP